MGTGTYEFREARRDAPHKLGRSFCSVGPLLSQPSPDGEHGVDYSLDRVEIAHRPGRGVSAGRLVTYRRLSAVCAPVDLKTVSDSHSTTVILPPHFSLSAIRSRPSWMRYVQVSILPCPSSGPSVYERSGARPDPVLYPVAQGPLVGLELYKEVPSLHSDLVEDVLPQGHGIGGEYLSRDVYLVDEPRHSLCRKVTQQ